MTDDELKKLAIDIRSGLVFGTWNLKSQDDLMHVFMSIALADEESLKKLVAENITHFYEYLSQSAPRSVNGYPCFFSCRKLTRDDSEKLFNILTVLEEAEKSALASI